MNKRKRVLVTGASSKISRGVIRKLEENYELCLLDLERSKDFPDHKWVVGSILNPSVLDEALENADAIVNFILKRGDITESIFDVNVKGLYVMFEALKRRNIQRFVHVSSTATVIGHWYSGTERITVESPFATQGRYSMCKMLQERICEHVARNSDIQIVALRPWAPCEGLSSKDEFGKDVLRKYEPGLIDTEDFGVACQLAIEANLPHSFEIFHTVATHEARTRFDSERTEKLLGFRAKEDFHKNKIFYGYVSVLDT